MLPLFCAAVYLSQKAALRVQEESDMRFINTYILNSKARLCEFGAIARQPFVGEDEYACTKEARIKIHQTKPKSCDLS